MVKELKAAIPNSKSARTPSITRKRVKRLVALRLPPLPCSRCWEEISDWPAWPDSCVFFFMLVSARIPLCFSQRRKRRSFQQNFRFLTAQKEEVGVGLRHSGSPERDGLPTSTFPTEWSRFQTRTPCLGKTLSVESNAPCSAC